MTEVIRNIFRGHRSRRDARDWAAAATASAAGARALGANRVSAQEASPVPEGMMEDDRVMTLFVQAFHNGRWSPGEEEGTYTLTLHGGIASTIYFSDRPARVFGASPTDLFLDSLGFSQVDPPNAAIVVNSEGEADILVIELMDPVYDDIAQNLTYTATVLGAYREAGLEYLAAQQADESLPQEFGAGALFIDDCADAHSRCYLPGKIPIDGTWVTLPRCYTYPSCAPCRSWDAICNQEYPDLCHGQCYVPTSNGPHPGDNVL